MRWLLFILLAFTASISPAASIIRRCFSCRSRGDLGDCRDPFFNTTGLNSNSRLFNTERKRKGVDELPCATGWCSKILEAEQDHGSATERGCMLRPPSDLKERCAPVKWHNKQVVMCFCRGDLCNGGLINATVKPWTVMVAVGIAMLCRRMFGV